ncbi:hypothetical protein LO80_00810 [Candidatus Francisella endociliophora]|uniref:Lipoprotein n=1 Tax=Candidatus Francisella endociliophora TaxID=653937 RepID=A0A097EM59_9GAMM|nr:DUF3568 family protein [Francisella sp. FSC1006]AIT08657.1 hypothetical protein LO80_00810 [Francisella sp. FSC1006]
MFNFLRRVGVLLLLLGVLNSCILFVPYAIDQEATYSENFNYPAKSVAQAVLDQFRHNQNITLTEKTLTNEKSRINGKVDSRRYKGTFEITISEITPTSSTLEIKYDIFGDKVRSQELLQDVEDDLHQNY